MKVKAIYESEVLKPLEKVGLSEGEEVEIEIDYNIVNKTFAISKLDDERIDEIIESTESGE